jgi:hypothetical protein
MYNNFMDILTKIFGNKNKIYLMRFFFMNQEQSFTFSEIRLKTKIKKEYLKKEILWLINSNIIKKVTKNIKLKNKKNKKEFVYTFNEKFEFKSEFYSILSSKNEKETDILPTRFKKSGKIDLFIVSGFFINSKNSILDILIVGNNLNKNKIEEEVSKIESEIGRELIYTFFNTEDFLYRAHMYDKLIRQVLDGEHTTLLDKGILSKIPTMS